MTQMTETNVEMDGRRERICRKRDRLKQLRSFCHAARLGSFTRAADALLLEPCIVSLHVCELERELGAALFERRGPNISLTSAGERFYRLSLPLVQGMDSLPGAFAEELDVPAREVRVAAGAIGAVFLIPRLVKRFRDVHPGVRTEVTNGSLRKILGLVRAGEVDVAFGTADAGVRDLRFRPCFAYELVLITPEDHPLAGRGSVSMEEVRAGPIVMPDPSLYCGEYGDAVRRWLGSRREVVVEASDWTALKCYVERGIGTGIVPSACLTGEERVRVVRLREHFEAQSYGVYTRRDESLSPMAAEFVRIVEAGLRPAVRVEEGRRWPSWTHPSTPAGRAGGGWRAPDRPDRPLPAAARARGRSRDALVPGAAANPILARGPIRSPGARAVGASPAHA